MAGNDIKQQILDMLLGPPTNSMTPRVSDAKKGGTLMRQSGNKAGAAGDEDAQIADDVAQDEQNQQMNADVAANPSAPAVPGDPAAILQQLQNLPPEVQQQLIQAIAGGGGAPTPGGAPPPPPPGPPPAGLAPPGGAPMDTNAMLQMIMGQGH